MLTPGSEDLRTFSIDPLPRKAQVDILGYAVLFVHLQSTNRGDNNAAQFIDSIHSNNPNSNYHQLLLLVGHSVDIGYIRLLAKSCCAEGRYVFSAVFETHFPLPHT